MNDTATHPLTDTEQRIRARGTALDLAFAQSLYHPLLQHQPRSGVSVRRDLVYGPDARHRLDLYQPSATSAADSWLLYLHGGGFIRGDKSDRENVGLYFARHGYSVAMANYRLGPAHRWPAGAEDVVRAYSWVRSQAGERGESLRIYVGGESAGAAHVATAGLMRRFHPVEGLIIAGLLLVSGVYNVRLEQLARRQFQVATPDPRNEAYFGSDFSRYADMSVVDRVDAAPLPLLISYAELDPPQMQVQAGELFARLVTHHRFDPDLHVVRGHNHLTQGYSINSGDESLSAAMLQFMQRPRSAR